MHNTWPGGLNLPPLKGKPPEKDVGPAGRPGLLRRVDPDGKPYRPEGHRDLRQPAARLGQHRARCARRSSKLDFYVYTGLFMEEAAYYADVILPVCSGLEMETVYMRRDDRAIRWQKQAVPRVGESQARLGNLDRPRPRDGEGSTRRTRRTTGPTTSRWSGRTTASSGRRSWRNTPGMGGMTQERMEKRAEPLRWPCPTPSTPASARSTSTIRPGTRRPRRSTRPTRASASSRPAARSRSSRRTSRQKLRRRRPRGAADLLHAPRGDRARTRRIEYTERTGAEPGQSAGADAEGRTRRAVRPARSTRSYPLMGMIGRPSVVHFAGVTQWT